MSFVERRTNVLKEGYQCKSFNILGIDHCVLITDFNRKSRSIQKYLLVTQGWETSSAETRIRTSGKILVTLRLEAGESS